MVARINEAELRSERSTSDLETAFPSQWQLTTLKKLQIESKRAIRQFLLHCFQRHSLAAVAVHVHLYHELPGFWACRAWPLGQRYSSPLFLARDPTIRSQLQYLTASSCFSKLFLLFSNLIITASQASTATSNSRLSLILSPWA